MMKKWLSVLLMLCMCLTPSLAEAPEESPEAAVEDISIAPVDAVVGEADCDFGDDGTQSAPQEIIIDEDVSEESWTDEGCYLDCPDVYDLRGAVAASDRVFPGAMLWPLPGTQPLAHVNSRVGWRNAARIHSGQGGEWPSWLHHGVDIGHVTTSQLVVAAADGVAYAGEQRGNGKYVVIDHGNGFYTKCQHLSRYAGEMFEGCREIPVKAGDPIGYVGCSGGDYPVHFHFEIAWSPDGAGSDDVDYHRETHNRKLYAYSFPQQSIVKMRWPERWELCSALNQTFVTDPAELDEGEDVTAPPASDSASDK